MKRLLRLLRCWYWRRRWQQRDTWANWEYALRELRKRNGWLS